MKIGIRQIEILKVLREGPRSSADFKDKVTISYTAVYTALRRLEEKGLVSSDWGPVRAMRGGKRRKIFDLTDSGRGLLKELLNGNK